MKNNMQEKKPKPIFSIIVPVYNVETYLRQCIESIINQTYSDIEIILVDDGSTDQSGEICDQYAERDSRIRVIHQENSGLQRVRTVGVSCATGQYVSFVDGDDFVQENMCKDISSLICESDPDIIITGSTYVYPDYCELYQDNIKSGFYDKWNLKDDIYKRMMAHGADMKRDLSPSVWAKWFKREIIAKVLPQINEKIVVGQDVPCTYHCMLLAESVFVCNDMHHYQYRYVTTSASRVYKDSWIGTVCCLCDQLDKIYESGDYQYIRDSFLKEKFRAFYSKANREFELSGKLLPHKIEHMRKAVDSVEIGKTLHDIDINKLNISIGKKIEFRFLRDRKVWRAYLIWSMCYTLGKIKQKLKKE